MKRIYYHLGHVAADKIGHRGPPPSPQDPVGFRKLEHDVADDLSTTRSSVWQGQASRTRPVARALSVSLGLALHGAGNYSGPALGIAG